MLVNRRDVLVSNSRQRTLIYICFGLYLAFGAGIFGFMRFFPPPPPTSTLAEVVALYTRNLPVFQAGVILALIGSAVMLPWSLVIYIQMARIERGYPVLSLLQLLTGAVGTCFMWMPPMLWGYAAFSIHRDPSVAMAFHELGWIFMVVPEVFWPIQLLSIVVIAFTKQEDDRYSAFPRWVGYLTALMAIEPIVEYGAIVFKNGPIAWNGLLSWYIPMALWGPWVLSVSISILRSLKHQDQLLKSTKDESLPDVGVLLNGEALRTE